MEKISMNIPSELAENGLKPLLFKGTKLRNI
jgi:hypothetical protein